LLGAAEQVLAIDQIAPRLGVLAGSQAVRSI